MADWERVAVLPKSWDTGQSAGQQPFTLRVCDRCAAVVLDTDEAQERHHKWHSVSAIGMDFGGLFQ